MADEKNLSVEPAENKAVAEKKTKNKSAAKKPNFFVRVCKKIGKLCSDVVGEMRKVVWTPKDELKKSTKIVLATVVAIGIAIAVVDTAFSSLVNFIASLIG